MRRVGLRRPRAACWGDHFEVDEALRDDAYCRSKRELLERNGLDCWAIGTHLVGQATATRSTRVIRACCPRTSGATATRRGLQRAAEKMKDTATASRRRTGRRNWSPAHLSRRCAAHCSCPTTGTTIARGYEDFAERWNPIIDVFDQEGVRFALEVHPTEIAYDFPTTQKTLEAIGHRGEGFGINFDPRTSSTSSSIPRRSSASSPTASTTCT